jgi:hypothetical protein
MPGALQGRACAAAAAVHRPAGVLPDLRAYTRRRGWRRRPEIFPRRSAEIRPHPTAKKIASAQGAWLHVRRSAAAFAQGQPRHPAPSHPTPIGGKRYRQSNQRPRTDNRNIIRVPLTTAGGATAARHVWQNEHSGRNLSGDVGERGTPRTSDCCRRDVRGGIPDIEQGSMGGAGPPTRRRGGKGRAVLACRPSTRFRAELLSGNRPGASRCAGCLCDRPQAPTDFGKPIDFGKWCRACVISSGHFVCAGQTSQDF